MTDIRAGNTIIRPSTGATVRWTPIEPVADEYDAAKALTAKGYSCLGVIGNASHLRGSGGHTPWCTEGYQGIACKAGRVYAIDLHLPDPDGTFLAWFRARLKAGFYAWVYYANFGGHQITRVDGFKGTYSSGDVHLHLSGLAGHEADNSSILRDWDAHLTNPALVKTASTTSTGGDMDAAQNERLINVERMLGALRDRQPKVTLISGGKPVEMTMGVVEDLNALGWTLGIRPGQVPEHVRDHNQQASLDELAARLARIEAALAQLVPPTGA